jgi:methylenetetrahydrofolate reductase (NADPH)
MAAENSSRSFSIEFYPPRTAEGEAKLDVVHEELARLQPDFFSVTYGAGGSTRAGTQQLVLKYRQLGSDVAPHLSFGGTSEEEVLELLTSYKEAGIKRIVALRGDIPSGGGASMQYRYASELVRFLREKTGDYFHIEVACYPEVHPEARSLRSDVEFFKQKVDAGANSAITQYENLSRFSAKCGAEIPLWLGKRLIDFGDDVDGLRDFGLEFVTSLCEKLLDGGAPGLHFYSMNLSKNVTQIWNNLSLSQRK